MSEKLNEILDVLSHTESVYCHLPGVGDYPLCSTRELHDLLMPEPRQLTLDELRQMDGQPVWNEKRQEWSLVRITQHSAHLINSKGSTFRLADTEPYDRPPGGEGR